MQSIAEVLRWRAQAQPDNQLFTQLDGKVIIVNNISAHTHVHTRAAHTFHTYSNHRVMLLRKSLTSSYTRG